MVANVGRSCFDSGLVWFSWRNLNLPNSAMFGRSLGVNGAGGMAATGRLKNLRVPMISSSAEEEISPGRQKIQYVVPPIRSFLHGSSETLRGRHVQVPRLPRRYRSAFSTFLIHGVFFQFAKVCWPTATCRRAYYTRAAVNLLILPKMLQWHSLTSISFPVPRAISFAGVLKFAGDRTADLLLNLICARVTSRVCISFVHLKHV